jgi:hypothetical protein
LIHYVGGSLDIDYLYIKGTTFVFNMNIACEEKKNEQVKKDIVDQVQILMLENQIIFEHLNIHILDNEKVNII